MNVLPFKIPISKIENNLYLGSIEDAYDVKKLSVVGITHILNMATEIPNFYETRFIYKKINGKDSPTFQLNNYFDEVADFIHEGMKTGKVFVHCFCGISRSTTAIIAYMIKYKSAEPKKTFESLRKKRWIVYPNDGFMNQLEEYYLQKTGDDKKSKPEYTKSKTKSKSNFTIKKVELGKYNSMNLMANENKQFNLRQKRNSMSKEKDSKFGMKLCKFGSIGRNGISKDKVYGYFKF